MSNLPYLLIFCRIRSNLVHFTLAVLSRYLVDNHAKLARYPAPCNISARLSSYFADNHANPAHYSKKLTGPTKVRLAAS